MVSRKGRALGCSDSRIFSFTRSNAVDGSRRNQREAQGIVLRRPLLRLGEILGQRGPQHPDQEGKATQLSGG
eukprot:1347022-Pyramimonas_sp.AAC.1